MINSIFTRQSFKPKNAVCIRPKEIEAEIYIWTETSKQTGKPKYLVKAFLGKAIKPTSYFQFATTVARSEFIKRLIDNRKSSDESKAERRKARSAPHALQVGTVLTCSWGYDQTNVDWYQVTKLIGKNTVEVRQIAGMQTQATGWAMGKCIPDIDNFTGDPMIKRVQDNGIRIASYAFARVWDGLPKAWTSYA
jgi:hypothetical protein